MVDSFSCHKATFMIFSRMHIAIQAGVDIRMSGAPPSAAFCHERSVNSEWLSCDMKITM